MSERGGRGGGWSVMVITRLQTVNFMKIVDLLISDLNGYVA